ncbi:hypothetical protein [Streptomyces varsoviensis]|uniref:hypothetical protein n=1 Tax=Streptomyces varsoviensis TaxID=67373 RepID=UPI000995FF6C|nr:hypothetical protein [Streptomyces varsoviensis]
MSNAALVAAMDAAPPAPPTSILPSSVLMVFCPILLRPAPAKRPPVIAPLIAPAPAATPTSFQSSEWRRCRANWMPWIPSDSPAPTAALTPVAINRRRMIMPIASRPWA